MATYFGGSHLIRLCSCLFLCNHWRSESVLIALWARSTQHETLRVNFRWPYSFARSTYREKLSKCHGHTFMRHSRPHSSPINNTYIDTYIFLGLAASQTFQYAHFFFMPGSILDCIRCCSSLYCCAQLQNCNIK